MFKPKVTSKGYTVFFFSSFISRPSLLLLYIFDCGSDMFALSVFSKFKIHRVPMVWLAQILRRPVDHRPGGQAHPWEAGREGADQGKDRVSLLITESALWSFSWDVLIELFLLQEDVIKPNAWSTMFFPKGIKIYFAEMLYIKLHATQGNWRTSHMWNGQRFLHLLPFLCSLAAIYVSYGGWWCGFCPVHVWWHQLGSQDVSVTTCWDGWRGGLTACSGLGGVPPCIPLQTCCLVQRERPVKVDLHMVLSI